MILNQCEYAFGFADLGTFHFNDVKSGCRVGGFS